MSVFPSHINYTFFSFFFFLFSCPSELQINHNISDIWYVRYRCHHTASARRTAHTHTHTQSTRGHCDVTIVVFEPQQTGRASDSAVDWTADHTDRYLHKELTYLLTPWSRVHLEKLASLQLVKKFPAFYGTRRFLTELTSARHLSLS